MALECFRPATALLGLSPNISVSLRAHLQAPDSHRQSRLPYAERDRTRSEIVHCTGDRCVARVRDRLRVSDQIGVRDPLEWCTCTWALGMPGRLRSYSGTARRIAGDVEVVRVVIPPMVGNGGAP